MKIEILFKKLEGIHTIDSIMDILNVNKKKLFTSSIDSKNKVTLKQNTLVIKKEYIMLIKII